MPDFNLSIKPSQIEILARPGSTIIQAFEVTNNSDTILAVSPSIVPWVPRGLDGSVDYDHGLSNPNIEFSLQNTDLRLNQTFRLKPKESKQLVLKIKTSANTSLGDSYSTFFISQDPYSLNPDGSSQSLSTGRIGAHILISSSNTDRPATTATITNFQAHPVLKDIFFTPIRFSFDVNNPTDFYFKTIASLQLTKDNLITHNTTLPAQNVLANYSRHFDTNVSGPFWPGKYTAQVTLDSNINAPTSSVDIYIFPFSVVIPLLLIFLFFIFIKKRKL